MRRARACVLLLLAWLLACGDSDESPPADHDAGDRPEDAAVRDGGEPHDARTPDEPPPPEDAATLPPEPDAAMPKPDQDAGVRTAAWTVLVYMAADNNLEKAGIDDLSEMLGVHGSDDVNIIVQIDRTVGFYDLGLAGVANWDSMKRFRVKRDALEELADLGELDTGSPKTLSDFLSWGLQTFPAKRRAIVLWDHGNAWRGYGGDDTSDKDQLDQGEIGQGIADGIHGSGLSTVDVIGFDACLMSSAATAELMQPFTRYLIASEELVPGNGWDYRNSLQYLVDHPDADVPSFAAQVIASFYAQSRDNRQHRDVTANLLDLSKLAEVDAATSSLLDAVQAKLGSGAREVAAAQLHALEYGHHADPNLAHHMRDLGDFAKLLAAADAAYADQASRLQKALQQLVVTSAYGSNKAASTGLSLYFPPLRAYYDADYDVVPQTDRWRSFLKAYYTRADAEQLEPPAFEDAHEHHPVGPGSAELPASAVAGCDPGEGPTITAKLSPGDAAQVANASLIAGFVETAT
ncbi:MAG TPA: clostripain-related cysteine peptidase, partial [Polyangiales bacterium]|nr:clostripain-related cysteine peptidase [Polyangiales bacterium]